jgi:hypothetical protein
VHCDVTPVETLSAVPPRAFVRWQLPDTPDVSLELEHAAGHEVLVVSTEERTRHLRKNLEALSMVGNLVLYRYASAGDVVADHGGSSAGAPP